MSQRARVAVVAAVVRFVPLVLLAAALACSTDQRSITAPSDAARLDKTKRSLPSAPLGVTATAGDAQATVAWQPPRSSGTSALVSYTVTSSPGAITVTVDGATRSATVTGLANGTAYTFTVTATNASGTGPASSPSNAVTPRASAPNAAPTATITAPASGATVTQGASVTFTGSGNDAEDGALSGASLVWTSSINGQIGTGTSFSTTTLSAGTHTITLTATDSKGAKGTATVTITVTASAPPPSGTKWVTGYYVGYQRSLYPETSVDFTYLTHVVVGAALPTGTGAGLDTAFFIDNVNGPRMARNLTARAHQYGRKAILMLGGAGYHNQLVTATNATNRAAFVSNLLRAMDALGFDGIDVDWEPVNSGDEPQALQFLKDLRAARGGMLITFPIGWVNANVGLSDSFAAQIAPYVDQLNIMSYQMADNWGGWVSWHSAALNGEGSNHPSSVSSSVRAYLGVGVPAAKLGVGIGAYGSCWRGTNAVLQPLGSSAGVVASDNVMSYATIMGSYYSSAAYKWDATAQMGYLSFASPTGSQQCTMVSYEDPQSVSAKGAYVKSQGLGGAIVWTIGQGHLPTAAAGQQDPLLQALSGAMR